jgi:hypothetical protein
LEALVGLERVVKKKKEQGSALGRSSNYVLSGACQTNDRYIVGVAAVELE